MMLAADYARAVAYLDTARLPAYVSYIEQAWARGLAGDTEVPQRIYVRTSDGAIVSGVHPSNARLLRSNDDDSDNQFGKHRLFDPACYTPKSETQMRWNGQPALRFDLQSTCKDDNGITELYADPQTLRPIAVAGTIHDTGDDNITVALELRYAVAGGYTLPSSIRAHAVGRGWLFWARERAQVDYTGYQFFQTPEFARKQASKP